MIGDSIVAVARRFSFVRETGGANRGLWVELFLRFCGIEPGESWCMAFVSYVLYIVYRGKPPLHKTASCDNALEEARAKGYVTTAPRVGALVFSMRGTDAHHVGILVRDRLPAEETIPVFAGNTSEDGLSSNGDGCYEHPVSRTDKVYVQLPEAA